MLILLDNNVPRPLRRHLPGHVVRAAYEMGWAQLSNGRLLAAAERDRFDVLITGDRNLEYQQNLSGRHIALVVLTSCQWPEVLPHCDRIFETVKAAVPGSYASVDITRTPKRGRSAS